MKLSVIIPTYNSEKNISECIESILKQNFSDMEIIIVNDGSTDDTRKKIEALSKKDMRIKIINQENKGVALTRRVGYDLSVGEYCIFMDSDDYWDEFFLNETFSYIENNSVDLVMFKFKRVDSKYNLLYEQPDIFSSDRLFTTSDKKIIYEKMVSGTQMNNLVTKLFKRDIFIGREYPDFEFISNGEDFLEVMTLIERAEKILYLNQSWYNYRFTENSLSNTFNIRFYKNIHIVRLELKKTINSKGMFDESVKLEFYRFYLISIAKYIERLFFYIKDVNDVNPILIEIKAQILFVEALKFVKKEKLNKKTRIILFLFLNNQNRLLRLFSLVFNKMRKTLKSIEGKFTL